MKLPTIMIRIYLCFILLAQSSGALAFETDQFNLPPAPLADIGDEVTVYIERNIQKAIDKLNREISARQSCLDNNVVNSVKEKCAVPDKERQKIQFLRSEQAVAREVYNLLGAGFPPLTNSGTWMETHQFAAQPARYKTSFGDSIFLTFPTDFVGLSSTVNLYDTQFGTDKIAHFFQQGYTYYKTYNSQLEKGKTPGEAARIAVNWGQKSERTFYGTLVSGVYSNGDLYANYVGMKFYLNLTRDIRIGDDTKSALLILKNGLWQFGDRANLWNDLIKPFISKSLNEAFNPSIYTKMFGLRSYVRRAVRKQSCRQWFEKYPNLSQNELENTSNSLKFWHGEDYGFTESASFVTIYNTCFDEKISVAVRNQTSSMRDFSTLHN